MRKLAKFGIIVIMLSILVREGFVYYGKYLIHEVLVAEMSENAYKHNITGMQSDLGLGVGVNELDKDGITPMNQALYGFAPHSTISWLLGHGAIVNLKDQRGLAPINIASMSGQIETIKYLLSNKADIETRDASGKTPLLEVCSTGFLPGLQIQVLNTLIASGAKLEAADNKGRTALLEAASHANCMDAVKYLLQHGVNINRQDNDGKTALMLAETPDRMQDAEDEQENIEVVKILVKSGISLDIKDRSGKTALENEDPRKYNWIAMDKTIHNIYAKHNK